MKEEDYDGQDRRQWHIDKTVNVGHLITTILLVGSVAGLWFKMDTRIALLEQAAVNQSKVNDKHEQADKDIAASVRAGFERIDAKLDRIIWERNGK